MEATKRLKPLPSTIAGALYDFAGFLTSRSPSVPIGASDDSSKMVELLKTWATARGVSIEESDADWNRQHRPLPTSELLEHYHAARDRRAVIQVLERHRRGPDLGDVRIDAMKKAGMPEWLLPRESYSECLDRLITGDGGAHLSLEHNARVVAILGRHVGEGGRSEGAVEVLERLVGEIASSRENYLILCKALAKAGDFESVLARVRELVGFWNSFKPGLQHALMKEAKTASAADPDQAVAEETIRSVFAERNRARGAIVRALEACAFCRDKSCTAPAHFWLREAIAPPPIGIDG